jgi:hypothetical protein
MYEDALFQADCCRNIWRAVIAHAIHDLTARFNVSKKNRASAASFCSHPIQMALFEAKLRDQNE